MFATKAMRSPSGDQLTPEMRAPSGNPVTGTSRPSRIRWNVRPSRVLWRLRPLLRGLIRRPARRSSGWATSLIGGRPGRCSRSSHWWSGLTATNGDGGASTMSASTCGGV